MSAMSLQLPDSLHKRVNEVLNQEGISTNQFITSAVAEKIVIFTKDEDLEKRAKRANKENFKEPLSKIPDIEPEEYDRL